MPLFEDVGRSPCCRCVLKPETKKEGLCKSCIGPKEFNDKVVTLKHLYGEAIDYSDPQSFPCGEGLCVDE